jgi:hypothetical protein
MTGAGEGGTGQLPDGSGEQTLDQYEPWQVQPLQQGTVPSVSEQGNQSLKQLAGGATIETKLGTATASGVVQPPPPGSGEQTLDKYEPWQVQPLQHGTVPSVSEQGNQSLKQLAGGATIGTKLGTATTSGVVQPPPPGSGEQTLDQYEPWQVQPLQQGTVPSVSEQGDQSLKQLAGATIGTKLGIAITRSTVLRGACPYSSVRLLCAMLS